MTKNIKKNAIQVDIFLKKFFKNQKKSNLLAPMKYSTLFGGKKNKIKYNYRNFKNI